MHHQDEHEVFGTIKDINKLCKEFGYYIEEDIHSFYLTGSCGEIFRAARLKEIQGFLHGIKFWKSL